MEALEAILSRKSIRKYTDQPVSEELVKELLQAAMSAPSAGNQQPWNFVIIRNRELLNAIPEFHPNAKMVPQCQVAILVCANMELGPQKAYWPQDCAAAAQSILIAAHAKGLGAVWCGIYPREERVRRMSELLNLPENITPFALIPLGYPAEEKPPSNCYDESRVHYDGW